MIEMAPIAMFAVAFAALLAGYSVALTLAGVACLFALIGIATGTFNPNDLGFLPGRMFGIIANQTLIAVPLFIFMGVMLEKTRIAHALLDALEVRRALVGRDDHLAVLIDQGVEGVEELLLGRLPSTDKLDIVDHQQIDRSELFLKRHGVLGAQRADELVHELFGRKIDNPAARPLLLDLQAIACIRWVLPSPTGP